MKKLLSLLIAVSCFMFIASSVNAQYGQYGQYGGTTPNFAIIIDKMVGKPGQTKGGDSFVYVDNLSASDARYAAGQDVWFKLKIKNTSNELLQNVTVKDFLPSYVDPVEGPGTYDAGSKTITIAAGDLNPDQEKEYFIKTRIVSQDQLPADKGIFCIVNKSQAYNDKISDEDSAQLCIEKQVQNFVQGVSKAPAAGPEMGTLLLSGQLFALGAGLFLKRKSQ